MGGLQRRRTDTPVSVADRLFAILGCFDPGHSTLTLSEISQLAGLPITTAFRLVAKLTEWVLWNGNLISTIRSVIAWQTSQHCGWPPWLPDPERGPVVWASTKGTTSLTVVL